MNRIIVTIRIKQKKEYDLELPVNQKIKDLMQDISDSLEGLDPLACFDPEQVSLVDQRNGRRLNAENSLLEECVWNGLLCVVLGGVMAAIWKKLAERPQGDMNMFKKVALGFLFVGLAFGVMVVCELVRGVGADASVKASVFWPFLFVTVITIGEMCFSPLRNAFVSKYAPKKYLSLLMGVIAISTFGANKLSPFVQAFIEKFDVFPVFVGITVIMLVFTALIFLANKKLNSLVEGKEEA